MKSITRTVPVERDGKTHHVPQTLPVPRDWDAIALGSVRVAASLVVAGALTWSTVAIGGLLAGMAPPWAAYLVAGVFDLGWVVCMVLEWLCRYDRKRAFLPIVCGWVSLAFSVSMITLHGAAGGGAALVAGNVQWSTRGTVIGVCGSAVSVLAKGMWTVVMRHTSVALDTDSQAWMDAERAETNAALAVTAARRQLARVQALTASEARALSAGTAPDTTWTAVRQDSQVSVPVVRDSGQDSGQDSGTGQGQTDRTAGQDRTPQRDSPLSELSGRQLPRAFVRGLLSADPELSNAQLSAAVRSEYGTDLKTDTVNKTIQRARGDLSRTA